MADVESGVFIEAMRQLKRRAGKGNFLQIHVSYVPVVPPGSGEQKTKPTQRAISDVRSAGLTPDLVCQPLWFILTDVCYSGLSVLMDQLIFSFRLPVAVKGLLKAILSTKSPMPVKWIQSRLSQFMTF